MTKFIHVFNDNASLIANCRLNTDYAVEGEE